MSKKTIALVLCMVMTMTIGLGSTLAYLTDTDADVNVMTLGNVNIEQIEQERDGNGALQPFTQAKPLYPAVGDAKKYLDLKDNVIPNANGSLAAYKFLANAEGEDLPNVQDKIVTVKNVGTGDAYVRTIIAFEVAADVNEVFPGGTHIGLMRNDGDNRNSSAGADTDGNTDWYWKWLENVVTIDGKNYAIATVTHKAILEAGETTIPSLLQVYLKKNADNEYVSKLGETYDILVVSQAVQAAGFTDAETALNEAFGEITVDNNPWKQDGKDIDGTPKFPVFVSDESEFVKAVDAGSNIVLEEDIVLSETLNIETDTEIDLNGHSLTASVFEAKTNTTLKNGTFVHGKSTYPALSVSAGTLKLENMKILCEEYCNIVSNETGTQFAAEYAALEIWDGEVELLNCDIIVRSDEKRYSNSVFAIGMHAGKVTMNGGSITVDNVGSTKINYEAPIFTAGDTQKVINLNDVTMNLGSNAMKLYAWGGHTTINTTDAAGSWDASLCNTQNDGTYVINYK